MRAKLSLGSLAVALVFVSGGGCALFNIAPARERLDQLWTRAMLTGRYSRWEDGKEVPWRPIPAGRDTVETYPEGALHTKYRIDVSASASPEGAAWDMIGGLVGRVATAGATVELFGKRIARVHAAPAYGSTEGRDFTYEFFLVVRPSSTGEGRLVKQWRFQPEDLALTGSPIDPNIFRRSTRHPEQIQTILHPPRGVRRQHFIDGYLDFDASTKIATVTVTGLKRPFQDRVDLSHEVRP